MTLRLSKPNTRAFLSYANGAALVFAKDPAHFISFAPVSVPGTAETRSQTVLEVAAVGSEPYLGTSYLALDAEGHLDLSDEPFGFKDLKLGSSSPFKLGNETLIAVDKTEWMKSHGGSIWPTVLFLVLLLIVACLLAHFGRNSPANASYIFYRS